MKKKGVSRRKKTTARRKKVVRKRTRARRLGVKKKQKKQLEAIGKVTHYFPKVKAGVVKMTKGKLALGDSIHIKGHTTDFKQTVHSIQLNHVPLKEATKGQEIGLAVKSRVRQNDILYKLAE